MWGSLIPSVEGLSRARQWFPPTKTEFSTSWPLNMNCDICTSLVSSLMVFRLEPQHWPFPESLLLAHLADTGLISLHNHVNQFLYLLIYLSIHPSIHPSIYPSIHLSILFLQRPLTKTEKSSKFTQIAAAWFSSMAPLFSHCSSGLPHSMAVQGSQTPQKLRWEKSESCQCS